MSELFWFPLNSMTFLLNLSLWILVGWLVYEMVISLLKDK